MTRRLAIIATLLGATAIAALVHSSSSQAAGPAAPASPPAAAPAVAAPTATHFSHADHEKRAVDITNCSNCHRDDAKGNAVVPGTSGHQPCLDAKCHATDFISVGASTKSKDPKAYGKAVSFCMGCHSVAVIQPWSRPPADNIYKGTGEHHVEMNHYDHTKLTDCRSCHIVDTKTLALETGTPGHAQCAVCHTGKPAADGKVVESMSKCDGCHSAPAASEYFTSERPNSDVRSCDSPAYAKALAANGGKAPCFKHERIEHRTAKDGAEVQCGTCHFMFSDKSKRSGFSYDTIKEIKAAPIIYNTRDLAHKACGGSSGCHQSDVNDSRGTGRCTLCHTQKLLGSLFQ